jgi:hypothetical protein
MYHRRCWEFPATPFDTVILPEKANDGGGRAGRAGLNVSGIPCRRRPNRNGGPQGRSIDGEKAFRFAEYRGKKK